MKKSEMNKIKKSRENLIGFMPLHVIRTCELYGVSVNGFSWNDVCDNIILAYENHTITNKIAEKLLMLVMDENDAIA